MPFQPPTRPHSANPHGLLNSAFFPSSSASSSRPPSHRSVSLREHTSAAYGRLSREAEWEDAWDSSSDKDEPVERSQPTSMPIPASRKSVSEAALGGGGSESSGVAASWNSASFHHVSHPTSSPNGSELAGGAGKGKDKETAPTGPENTGKPDRPSLLMHKTYADATTAPEPGTAGIHAAGAGAATSRTSKLPPGGSWEIVEEAELKDEVPVDIAQAGKEAVRHDVEDILRDPLQLLQSLSISIPSTPTSSRPSNPSSTFPFLSPVTPTSDSRPTSSLAYTPPEVSVSSKVPASRKEAVSRQRSVRTERKREKFGKVLKGKAENAGGVDLGELKRLAWSGVPNEVRPIVWQLLLNYLPSPSQPRLTTLNRKRKEYSQLVDQYFGRGLAYLDQQIWHQIEIDVPRTRPGVPLWSCITAQRALERILYVWAIRHPASGYVQGINDLVCPFFQVFLNAYIDSDPELFDVVHLPADALAAIEADTFWCLSKLLDGIQDNYISQQPGIQRLVKRMGDLVKRIDAPLAAHFDDQGVEFMQFAFRWMNCLLMREISVKCTIRMWDTYLAEGTDAFSQFHLYVCSALLVKYSERLREMDFQEMIIFLQNLPTQTWNDHDIELLLSEAYVLKTVWQGAENHFANLPNAQGGNFGMLGR